LEDSQIIYRIARKPDPWAPPDWAAAPFSNRYDDPEGKYRVLYGCSQKVGCFVETLARFRKGPAELAAQLTAIKIDPQDDDFPPFVLGEIPSDWFSTRTMGMAKLNGSFADICSAEWIRRIRLRMMPFLPAFGLEEFDASTIQSGQREVTQMISRFVYESGADGIVYPSKHGHDFKNWAIFEPFEIEIKSAEPITPDHPDFLKSLTLLNLRLES
jgi:hypothetical protein